jgi:AhpD family alkylhydroperoxidase
MDPRFDLQNDIPDAFKAVAALEAVARKAVGDHTLYELVKLRASIINGCSFCIDMHSVDLAGHGEDWRRLIAVSGWRESSFFTPAERAAFALVDEVTRLGEHGVTDEVWDEAVEHHGLAGAADLVVAIATINVWNRLAVTAHAPTPPLAAEAAA